MAAVKADIDYRVTFPSVHLSDGQKEPVVILLGWAGCEDRHLAKYISIYEKRCITISYTAPSRDIFFVDKNLCLAAEKLLEIIVDLDLKAHPIFVHSFSNGGAMVYRWIPEIIHSKAAFKEIWLAGAIFDSCPGKRNMFQGIKALMLASKSSVFIKFFIALLFVFLVACAYVKNKVKSILHLADSESTNSYWQTLENDRSTCPQLYLYSRADEIISYLDVENMIAVRIQRGVDVQSICWEDSRHVAHLMEHREPYIKACLDFIDCHLEKKIFAV